MFRFFFKVTCTKNRRHCSFKPSFSTALNYFILCWKIFSVMGVNILTTDFILITPFCVFSIFLLYQFLRLNILIILCHADWKTYEETIHYQTKTILLIPKHLTRPQSSLGSTAEGSARRGVMYPCPLRFPPSQHLSCSAQVTHASRLPSPHPIETTGDESVSNIDAFGNFLFLFYIFVSFSSHSPYSYTNFPIILRPPTSQARSESTPRTFAR